MKRTAMRAAGATIAVAGAVALTAPSAPAAAGEPAHRPAPALLAGAAADRLVAADPAAFRLSEADELVQQSNLTGAGLQYVAYERTHRGLPVLGGDAVVVTDAAGTVLSTRVAQTRELDVTSTRAAIPAAAATRTARAQLRRVDRVGTPRLVVVADGAGRLAYEVAVAGADRRNRPARLHVVVDARSGRVIDDRTRNDVVHATGNGAYYGKQDLGGLEAGKMVDPSRPGLQCGGRNGAPYASASNEYGTGGAMDLPSGCADALWGAQKEWDMLKDWLGRNGMDGAGRGFPVRVGLQQVNAYWTGDYAEFGYSQDKKRQLTNMDVVGHEFGHGIFQHTPGGAGDWEDNENGGLNESTGDIFGALTEFYANHPADKPDYEVGELPNLIGKGPIRYMYEPSKVGDPNCYSSKIPNTEVHAAAGPQNHWFYLLAEGSNPTNGQPKSPTCNNSTVAGIGIQKAGKVFMGTLMRKTSEWTHASARAASVAAAKELFPTGGECAAVQKAWDAVSVPAGTGESCPSAR
ncbi:hypothetical protein GCM10010123_45200 [Pilimelia anulata]|uniref:Neutral metalloproteinase n=1 Tax=Pilimelia anulata TaxID=53371 RepID=A0A8J3BF06_9ACTN|nr:M4 family metallopeptidase [Pilimelia anulata]GGK10212.1 hypothetical protein GCM10010123_45200 [Pilimelia anulata]